MVNQGDIIKVNLNPQQGHEQAGYRPALIVSNNMYHRQAKLAIVCPITNTNNRFPLHVPLDNRTKTTGVVYANTSEHLTLKLVRISSLRKHQRTYWNRFLT